ncbi:MAG TPA: glycosyltransferase family 4 protein [Anaerolineales bacterium]|nr:glycosyltransferase family 4 protein [Anaerolineales bacterium]
MKFAFVANTSWGHYNSRLRLAIALRERGHEVVFLSPHDEYSQRLVDSGFRWMHLAFLPRGRSVFLEGAAILRMMRLLRTEAPDVVHNFTPKGVIYGSIAAKLAGIGSIANTITGLGHVFSTESTPHLRPLVTLLYWLALRGTTVLFQNQDDARFFADRGITRGLRTRLIPGSGVDDTRYHPAPEAEGTPVVMLPSRFVEEKGIRDFVAAARLMHAAGTAIRAVLVGRPEPDQPTAIPSSEITSWVAEGVVEWWGWHEEMEGIFPHAHVVCLPTYYREGMPKSLLEAAACGLPLVATDVPGCRDIVRDGENGFLVPPRDPAALARAITKLVLDASLRERMGRRGRQLVHDSFSLDKVIPAHLEVYGIPN